MTGHKADLIQISSIASMHDVIKSLEQLNGQLTGVGLEQFKVFNATYLVVTHSIRQAIEDGSFKNPQFIETLLVTFAGYYFRAINASYSKGSGLSLPWAKLNEYATLPKAPAFISLMLGANAHICDDLPRALNELMPAKITDELREDLAKIDGLLMKSGAEVPQLFAEQNRFYEFLKRRLQFTYYRPAMYTILYWRAMAWRNYQKLRSNSIVPSDITQKSVKISDRLIKIAKFLG